MLCKPGAQIYKYSRYDDPPFLIYDPASAPRFSPGEGLRWSCYWENPTDNEYKFGPFTDTNEHCNLFAFYYPAKNQDEAIQCVKEFGTSTTTVRTAH